MKKTKRVFVCVLCLISLVAVFTACNSMKKVTFVVDGKETVVEVKKGEKVEMPENPVKEGYVFSGWYTTAEGEERYDFDKEVKDSFNLYAKFDIDQETPDESGGETPDENQENGTGGT